MSGCISYGRETCERLYQVHIKYTIRLTSLRLSVHPDEVKNIKITIARPGWLHLCRGTRSLPSSLSAPALAYRPQTHGTHHW